MPRLLHTSLVVFLVHALPVSAGAGSMAPGAGSVACRQLLAMNKVGQITVAMATKDALGGNAYVQSLDDEEVLRLALAACSKNPKGNVLSAVKVKG